jgi:hypothetical protein
MYNQLNQQEQTKLYLAHFLYQTYTDFLHATLARYTVN